MILKNGEGEGGIKDLDKAERPEGSKLVPRPCMCMYLTMQMK
jgi:hypothetical protein